mmetsp:Transcript_25173/g.53514  ORF Transcript_25173/g.53514 Transcript_25173/m.53514 type:complete len:218 (-) Transcript_25173:287-940(-)
MEDERKRRQRCRGSPLCHVRGQLRSGRVVPRPPSGLEMLLQGTTPAPRLQDRPGFGLGPGALFHHPDEPNHGRLAGKLFGDATGRRSGVERNARGLLFGGHRNRQGQQGKHRSVPAVLRQGSGLPGNRAHGGGVRPVPGAGRRSGLQQHCRGHGERQPRQKQRQRHSGGGRIFHTGICPEKEFVEAIGRHRLPLRSPGGARRFIETNNNSLTTTTAT